MSFTPFSKTWNCAAVNKELFSICCLLPFLFTYSSTKSCNTLCPIVPVILRISLLSRRNCFSLPLRSLILPLFILWKCFLTSSDTLPFKNLPAYGPFFLPTYLSVSLPSSTNHGCFSPASSRLIDSVPQLAFSWSSFSIVSLVTSLGSFLFVGST